MSLEKNLKDLSLILEAIKGDGSISGYALIGGLSVATWGVPRATMDIDFVISVVPERPLDGVVSALVKKGLRAELHRGAHTDPVPYLIRGEIKGVPFDLIISTKKWENEAIDAAVGVKYRGAIVPVIPVEYLIVMKLKANGLKDVLDVKELLRAGSGLQPEPF